MPIGPERCSAVIGTPDLTYDYYCALPLYQARNATQDPLDTLRGCCPSPEQNVGFFGTDNCNAYCNATSEETKDEVKICLDHSMQLSEWGCSSGGVGGLFCCWVDGCECFPGCLSSVLFFFFGGVKMMGMGMGSV
ncbi:hypothetical protein BDW59DRAFT_147551 [Aspergillus cavernicola]|uniref:Uncharacterized protein n=1 Tax=Aspergillus cavernicola TaxID=176166 RepID=A0ABR4IBM4_9EURO